MSLLTIINKCKFPILLVIVALFYTKYSKNIINFFNSGSVAPDLFTIEELSDYNGINKNKLYLSILGIVFDVTSAADKYGPGKTYHFFTGRDGSRNFINGKFNEHDASDKIHDLEPKELISLENWVKFYNKEYKKIGKLIGTYYDKTGELTPYGKTIKKLISEAHITEKNKMQRDQEFPPCNVEWSAEKGTRVWCTQKSGGIQRNWVGFPRQLYEPGLEDHQCVCVNKQHLSNPNLREYQNCKSNSIECYVI